MNKRQYKKYLIKRQKGLSEMDIKFIRLLRQLTPSEYFIMMNVLADFTEKIISTDFDMNEYTEKKLAIYNSEKQQEAIKELNSRLGFISIDESQELKACASSSTT